MKIKVKISYLSLCYLVTGLLFYLNTFVKAIAISHTSIKSSPQINKINLYNNIKISSVEALIPGDRTDVDLMQIVPPIRLVELSQKFKIALQKNSDSEWLSSLIKNTPAGQPLPYDPRLGVSKTEYQEFLSLSQKLIAKKIGTSILQVKREGNKYVFLGNNSLSNLTGIKLDLDRNLLETPYGTTAKLLVVVAHTERQHLTGAWSGFIWKLEQFDRYTNSTIKIQFSLGRMTHNGRGILHYDITRISDRAVAKSTPLILQYDLVPFR
ncbi:MAG: hypothetical protein N4J56_003864 [Chroococcidiopsis sp. SAG 2025]|nr:hypothetical protein [Chroococcidiopsis sp. SAG 2025]